MTTPGRKRSVQVYKFGGTSLATTERISRAAELVRGEPEGGPGIVVVSAMGGVTDHFLEAIEAALERSGGHADIVSEVQQRHDDVVNEIAGAGEREGLRDELSSLFGELGELLDGVFLVRECTHRTRDAVLSIGERASAPLMAAAFRAQGQDAAVVDARELIRTDATFGEANVLNEPTRNAIRARFEEWPLGRVAVVTGFIAATERGVTTTLGRSGSDYTATIIGAATEADRVTIWTDVDGVLSADPRLVPEASPLTQLTYQEAGELAYFGAKVLHPRTMRPLQQYGIPLRIRNTMNPEAPGTMISSEVTPALGHVKGISTIRDAAVVMLEGAGMLGVPGIAARMFGALAAESINVLMISQASSEQNICVVVNAFDAARSVQVLEAAFEREIERGDVHRVTEQSNCAVVSAVGDQMRQRTGLAGRMFSTLGRSGVNVLAIAQGASETNISAVVRDDEVRHSVRALHEAFAMARNRAHIFLVGRGVVGDALLQILKRQAPFLLERLNLNLCLVGLANTRKMLWDIEGVSYEEATARLDSEGEPMDLHTILNRLANSRLDRLIVVDATASETVASHYPDLLEHNVAVITPNKRANAHSQAYYDRLQQIKREHQVPYLYETTVGAGLPVIATLRDLRDSGDRIERIEGVFSGTLAFLFNSMADGASFSQAVRTARKHGYTEPDPRDDLCGEDVARKLLVLTREMGYSIERSDIQVESLVPESLLDVPLKTFMDEMDTADAKWSERMKEAAADGRRLQYVGVIEEDKPSVRVKAVGPESPFSLLRGTANMIVFTTEHYRDNPLVIQGPGAGPRVTAAGVLSDIIRAAQQVSP